MTEAPTDNANVSRARLLWQQNHGNVILGVMAAICLVGFATLAYRQTRFIPPRFPEARSLRPITEDGSEMAPASSGSTFIRVVGAANDQGQMMLAVYGSEEDFNNPSAAILRLQQPITENAALFQLDTASWPSRIAVAAYHDENNDEALTRNAIGIPIERYGFSNNARGTVGPPKFEECAIETPSVSQLEIEIR